MDWQRNHFAMAYIQTMNSLNIYGEDRSLDISMSQFKKGSCIFVINCSPSEVSDVWELKQQGSVGVIGRFGTPVPGGGIRMITMAEFDNVIQVDAHRNVIVDFAL